MSYRGIRVERKIHTAQLRMGVALILANAKWADNMDGDQDEAVRLYRKAHRWLTRLVLLLEKSPR